MAIDPKIQASLSQLRLLAQQKGIYQKVFLQGASGYTSAGLLASDFRSIAKLSGLNIPTGAYVGLDTVQIVLAGGAFTKDIIGGASTLQCVGAFGQGLSGVANLLSDLGLVDPAVSDIAGVISNGISWLTWD